MLISSKSDLADQVYPIILDPKNPCDKEKLIDLFHNPQITIVDQIENQVADLMKSSYPSKVLSKGELDELVEAFFNGQIKEDYGNWVYYPWKYTVVHLLPAKEFIKIRTLRNNYKITPQEQAELSKKKIGIVGLSVGQSIALAMALERSCGEMRLADFDTLELSNLNRLKAGVTSLGVEKIVIAAREISEIDPYLKLTLFRDGITEENVESFFDEGGDLDLVIDECDSLDIKILLRETAKRKRVPLLMDTSDRGMLDVERFDEEPDRPIFHGFLGNVDLASLKNLSNKQKVAIGLKMTGVDTLSPRMKASLLEVGQTISSWPQLASAVFLGGASVAHVGRKLLLDEPVKSGRYYVDLDEIVHVDIPESKIQRQHLGATNGNYLSHIPKYVLPSGYILDKVELEEMVSFANLAPSGGNVQPWIWVFDKNGVLHLFHDQLRSHSLLDFKGTGSLIAFGAALENIRLYCSKAGIEIEIIEHIQEFEEELIASIRFEIKHTQPLNLAHSDLVEGVALRCTNRKNTVKKNLDPALVHLFSDFAEEEGLGLKHLESNDELEKLSGIIGGMDRMRLFHEQGLQDFIGEVRWNDAEASETKDGIDIATLELSGTERAAMGLLRDPRTVRFFRKFLMGYGLTKISHETLMSSSAVFLLEGKEFTPKAYLNAGKVLQRIWVKANMIGVSFQPVTAAMFIFHKVEKEEDHGFSEEEVELIKKYKEDFNSLFNKEKTKEEIFMFRLNYGGEPSMRSYRRNTSDTLIIE